MIQQGTIKASSVAELPKARILGALLVLLPWLLCACASPKRPVLYPNDHLRAVGSAQAQADIEACMQSAYASGADEGKGGKLVKDTTRAGAVGAATGAVVGAIASGDAGRGAAMAGAGAATATLVSGAFDVPNPSPIFMQFVDRCLRERGYDPLGWR